MEDVPLSQDGLFKHKCFSNLKDPRQLYGHLDTIKHEQACSKQVNLCMWSRTEGINDTMVNFLTAHVWYYDADTKTVITHVHAKRIRQHDLFSTVLIEASGFMAFNGSNFMFLNKSYWQTRFQTIENDAAYVKTLQDQTPEEVIVAVMVPLYSASMTHKHFKFSRQLQLWCKGQGINPHPDPMVFRMTL